MPLPEYTLTAPVFNAMPAPDKVMTVVRALPSSWLRSNEGVNEIVAVVDVAFTADVNVMARPFNQEMPGNVPVLVKSMMDEPKLFEVAAATFVSPA